MRREQIYHLGLGDARIVIMADRHYQAGDDGEGRRHRLYLYRR